MSDGNGAIDGRASPMRLRFVTEEEQQKLVAAWPNVKRRDGSQAMYREWFAAAGVADRYMTRTWAISLMRLGICREDGTIDHEIAQVIAANMVTRFAGPRGRAPKKSP